MKVAVPQRGAWDAGVAELGQRGGIFKKHGLNLEILYVQAGPESIQAVIGGSIDIATAAGVSAAVGTFAKGAPIRIIGSEIIGSPDLYWYVPANSPIRKVEDFNGKTVAYLLDRLVEPCRRCSRSSRNTSSPPSRHRPATSRQRITQTMTGQVDVGFGAAPFGLDLVEDGKIRIIATGNDVASLRTRTGARQPDQREHAAEPPRRDRPLQSRLSRRRSTGCIPIRPRSSTTRTIPVCRRRSWLRVRELHPEGEHGHRSRVEGIDQIMADAVAGNSFPRRLTAEQVKELVQIPN